MIAIALQNRGEIVFGSDIIVINTMDYAVSCYLEKSSNDKKVGRL